MPDRLTLARRIDASAAKRRLQRLGSQRFEPVWIALWACPVGNTRNVPVGWLLSAQQVSRALLLACAELPASIDHPPNAELQVSDATPPTPSEMTRLWLWERMAKPRLWRTQILGSTPKPLWIPCWLGYSIGRQHRVTVISGLSGEPLPMLKPLILSGLKHQTILNPDGINHTMVE